MTGKTPYLTTLQRLKKWAARDLNPRPLPCQGSTRGSGAPLQSAQIVVNPRVSGKKSIFAKLRKVSSGIKRFKKCGHFCGQFLRSLSGINTSPILAIGQGGAFYLWGRLCNARTVHRAGEIPAAPAMKYGVFI